MSNKLISIVGIIILFAGIFTVFATMACAKGSNIFCSKKSNITVILKDYAGLDMAEDVISNIKGVKIVKIQDRSKEWSKKVNKYDLPNMENPFKNEFTLKINKKADTTEIINKIKELDFVEDVKYFSDNELKK